MLTALRRKRVRHRPMDSDHITRENLSPLLALVLILGLLRYVCSRQPVLKERQLNITPLMNAKLKEEGNCFVRGSSGLLGPDNVHCPMAKEGFVDCCHCLLDSFFYGQAMEAKSRYATRHARSSKQTEPPFIEWDRQRYRAPVEADELLVPHNEAGPGFWKHVYFKCRVTLSDEEYIRYFSHKKHDRAASFENNLPRVTRHFKTYCLPAERLVVLTLPTKRQYTLYDAAGKVRTTATSGYCEPVKYRDLPVIPEGTFPIRTMMPGLHESSTVATIDDTAPVDKEVGNGLGLQRTRRGWKIDTKIKRQKIQSAHVVSQPASSNTCIDITIALEHVGENVIVLGRTMPLGSEFDKPVQDFLAIEDSYAFPEDRHDDNAKWKDFIGSVTTAAVDYDSLPLDFDSTTYNSAVDRVNETGSHKPREFQPLGLAVNPRNYLPGNEAEVHLPLGPTLKLIAGKPGPPDPISGFYGSQTLMEVGPTQELRNSAILAIGAQADGEVANTAPSDVVVRTTWDELGWDSHTELEVCMFTNTYMEQRMTMYGELLPLDQSSNSRRKR